MILHHTGIRRSGTHAVTEWVLRHFNGLIGLANSVQTCPLRTYKTTHVFRDGESVTGEERAHIKQYDSDGFDDYPKDHLVITYEDFYRKMDFETWLENTLLQSDVVGEYDPIYRVATLRSFYNMVASRIRQGERAKGRSGSWREDALGGWIEMATDYFKHPELFVLYDQIHDPEKREQFRSQLNIPDTFANRADEGLQLVAFKDYGGVGSSFDMYDFHGEAGEMQTDRRYEKYLTHPIMLQVLESDDARELNHEIFGWTLESNGKLRT